MERNELHVNIAAFDWVRKAREEKVECVREEEVVVIRTNSDWSTNRLTD